MLVSLHDDLGGRKRVFVDVEFEANIGVIRACMLLDIVYPMLYLSFQLDIDPRLQDARQAGGTQRN
jgi:hypothetical protein